MANRRMQGDVGAWAEAGLIYEIVDEVAWLRLNRPERRNALDHYPGGNGPLGMGLRDALLFAIHDATEDNDVRAAVITANGSVFCAGADLRQPGGALEIPPERRRNATVARDDGMLYGWYRLFEAIWRSQTPFIAAVNGPAIGAGCQLALACDLIYAAREATFWEIFGRIGLPIEGGAAWLLTRSLSLARAKEMALLAEPLPADKAEQWGLINQSVPLDELEGLVAGVAHKLATLGPPSRGPAAFAQRRDVSARIGHIKGQINSAWEQTIWQTFREEVSLLNIPPGDASEPGPVDPES